MPDSASKTSVIKHLLSVVSFGCLKKGDLISIALNTAGVPLYFKHDDVQPDPVSVTVDDVIWKFSLLVLASGDLIPLISAGHKLKLSLAGREIISWATHLNRGILDEQLPNPLPDSITAITQEYIEMDLLVFESLPKAPTPESQAKATAPSKRERNPRLALQDAPPPHHSPHPQRSQRRSHQHHQCLRRPPQRHLLPVRPGLHHKPHQVPVQALRHP